MVKKEGNEKKKDLLAQIKIYTFIIIYIIVLILIFGGVFALIAMWPLFPYILIFCPIMIHIFNRELKFNILLILMIAFFILFGFFIIDHLYFNIREYLYQIPHPSSFLLSMLTITTPFVLGLIVCIYCFFLTDEYKISYPYFPIFMISFYLTILFVLLLSGTMINKEKNIYNYGTLTIFFIFILSLVTYKIYKKTKIFQPNMNESKIGSGHDG
jgi:hypothetical protein